MYLLGPSYSIKEVHLPPGCTCWGMLLGVRLLWKSFLLVQEIPEAEESSSLSFPLAQETGDVWSVGDPQAWLPLARGVVGQ